jgi:hypothetical protein
MLGRKSTTSRRFWRLGGPADSQGDSQQEGI